MAALMSMPERTTTSASTKNELCATWSGGRNPSASSWSPPPPRLSYREDVSYEEWAFVAPYLMLMKQDAPQRDYALREVFNALRWVVRAGAPWRMIPHDLPPWHVVYEQTQRWIKARVFEYIAHDLREILRLAA